MKQNKTNKKLFVVIGLMLILSAVMVTASEEKAFGIQLATALFSWAKGLFTGSSVTGMAITDFSTCPDASGNWLISNDYALTNSVSCDVITIEEDTILTIN